MQTIFNTRKVNKLQSESIIIFILLYFDSEIRITGLNVSQTILGTGCPNKHGNSILSLLRIWQCIPNFKSHNIIMSARVYFMKTVNSCKDVSIMSPQDEQ